MKLNQILTCIASFLLGITATISVTELSNTKFNITDGVEVTAGAYKKYAGIITKIDKEEVTVAVGIYNGEQLPNVEDKTFPSKYLKHYGE